MKKMYIISIVIIIALGVGVFIFINKKPSQVENQMLNKDIAFKYVADRAKSMGKNLDGITNTGNGGFYRNSTANHDSIDFEYDAKTNELILRSMVVSNATGLDSEKNKDAIAELNRISQEEPDSVDGATFEMTKLPWEEYPNPELYFKKIITNGSLSNTQFKQICDDLSKTAYQWTELYFQQLMDRVIEARK